MRVRIEPEDDSERLWSVRAGGTAQGVDAALALDAPGLIGVSRSGAAVWRSYRYRRAALYALASGEDPTTALQAHAEEAETGEAKEKAEREARAASVQRQEAEAKAAIATTPTAPDGTPVRYNTYEYGDQPEYYLPGTNHYSTPAEAIVAYVSEQERVRQQAEQRALDEAAKTAAKEKADAERAAWTEAHGSEGLRERVRRGYDCVRRYATERLAAELPEWAVEEYDGHPRWTLRDRSCPSDAALAIEDAAEAAGYEAKTKWAVWEHEHDEDGDCQREDGGCADEAAEVVVVDNWHGEVVYRRTGVQ